MAISTSRTLPDSVVAMLFATESANFGRGMGSIATPGALTIDQQNPDTLVPVASCADDIVVVVAGGDGRHSAWLGGWGVSRVVT